MIDNDSYSFIATPARRWALDKGEIFVEYQPILTRASDKGWEMGGVEALPCWQHPKRGVLPPAAFVPALEKAGLLSPLSEFVLNESVRQVAAWRQCGLNISVAVKLSAALLAEPDFPARLVAVLDNHHLDYAKLVLELSADLVMHGSVNAIENLRCLRDKGFGLTVDGFGTGYVSLSQLHHRLPCNELKIDSSLVQNIRASNSARATIHAIIFLCHKLGVSICADGVETEYAFSFLTDTGCDRLQGGLLSPPLSAVKLQDLVREWHNADQAWPSSEGQTGVKDVSGAI